MPADRGPQVQHMMSQKFDSYNPPVYQKLPTPNIVPMQPIKRSPTVGEILGIPPGSVPGI